MVTLRFQKKHQMVVTRHPNQFDALETHVLSAFWSSETATYRLHLPREIVLLHALHPLDRFLYQLSYLLRVLTSTPHACLLMVSSHATHR
jgi:hypothetical protein